MAKSGRGVLLIITDIDSANEAEFNDWYDREHLRERVEIPGFLCARRYRAIAAERKYLAAYETENIDVLESPVYRRRLANQTDRSKRVLKNFIRPHRAIASVTVSEGVGVGGAIGVVHFSGTAGAAGAAGRERIAEQVLPKLLAHPGTIAAHLLESEPRLSQPLAETGPVATPLAAPDDWFLVIEASDAAVFQAVDLAGIVPALEGLTARRLGTYLLMSELSLADLR